MPRPVRKPTSKELQIVADTKMIRAATQFTAVFFIGRDQREDHGVITKPLHESVYFPTLTEARAEVARRGADQYGRRGIVRAIYKRHPDQEGGEVGVHVPHEFIL
jgi:hypothetical protein